MRQVKRRVAKAEHARACAPIAARPSRFGRFRPTARVRPVGAAGRVRTPFVGRGAGSEISVVEARRSKGRHLLGGTADLRGLKDAVPLAIGNPAGEFAGRPLRRRSHEELHLERRDPLGDVDLRLDPRDRRGADGGSDVRAQQVASFSSNATVLLCLPSRPISCVRLTGAVLLFARAPADPAHMSARVGLRTRSCIRPRLSQAWAHLPSGVSISAREPRPLGAETESEIADDERANGVVGASTAERSRPAPDKRHRIRGQALGPCDVMLPTIR